MEEDCRSRRVKSSPGATHLSPHFSKFRARVRARARARLLSYDSFKAIEKIMG